MTVDRLLKGSVELLERLDAGSTLSQQVKDALAALGYKAPASWLSLGRAPSLQQAYPGDSSGSWSSVGMLASCHSLREHPFLKLNFREGFLHAYGLMDCLTKSASCPCQSFYF